MDVWVCSAYPNGLLEDEYRQLVRGDPLSARLHWRRMRRDAAVYARGEIHHPDHRTITLPLWHRVLMNTETNSVIVGRMAFLD